MYRSIFITLLILTSFACQLRRAQISGNSVKNDVPSISNSLTNSKNGQSDENVDEFVETFTDDKNIGVRGKNKIEISMIRKTDSLSNVELKFYSFDKNDKWELKQKIQLESGSNRLEAELSDFNNDNLNDLTYVSALAARGANEIRTLLIYDPKNDKLIYIKNSENYSNLFYNKELNCISAQRFYGGNATDFARIEGDTIKTFAYIETFGTERKVYLIDKKDNRKLLRTDKVSNDEEFELYKTFDPPKVYTAEELEQ